MTLSLVLNEHSLSGQSFQVFRHLNAAIFNKSYLTSQIFSSGSRICDFFFIFPFFSFLYFFLYFWLGGLVTKLCPALATPWLQDSSVHRILQARMLGWVVISFSRWSSWPRNITWVSCFVGRFLLTELWRETLFFWL